MILLSPSTVCLCSVLHVCRRFCSVFAILFVFHIHFDSNLKITPYSGNGGGIRNASNLVINYANAFKMQLTAVLKALVGLSIFFLLFILMFEPVYVKNCQRI